MDSRRRNGLIALVVLVAAIAALVYYELDGRSSDPTTAFAPAESAEEAAAPEASIELPADVAAVPASDETAAQTTTAGQDPAVAGDDVAEAATDPEIAGQAGSDVAMAEPSDELTEDPDAAAVGAVPTFDIVRVEPSGDTVIAGQAEPNATVEIMDGPVVIASAEANEAGEWAIVLDEPLEPGTHDLAIATTSADESVVMLSDERVTVSVPEEGSADVLVVLNTPDAPSTVLQVPPQEDEIAAVGEALEADAEVLAEAGAEVAAEAEVETALGEAEAAIPEAEVEAVAEAEVETLPEAEVAAAGEAPGPGAPAEQEVALADPGMAEATTGEAQAPAELANEPGEAPAVAAVAEEPPPAAIASEGVIADQAGTDQSVPAGTVLEPEQEIALTSPAEEATPAGPAVADGTGAAALPSTELPAGSESVAPGAVDSAAAPEMAPVAETEVAAVPETTAVEEPPPPMEPLVLVAAVEVETDGSLYIAGTATTGEIVRVYVDGEHVGDAVPSPSGTWLVETTVDLPAGTYTIRADQMAEDGTVVARYEVPFDREVEVAVLAPTGSATGVGGATLAGAMPGFDTVIIKRGDNLWRIARATWGKGIRWSTIYQANTDQIRNPHRIYPGQVFVMPKGDTAWQN